MADYYHYRARDRVTGLLKKGRVESESEEEAVGIINKNGLIPITVAKESKGINLEFLDKYKKVSGREIAVFTRMLATMISSGLTLNSALSNLADQTSNSKLKTAIKDCIKKITGGSSFGDALNVHQDIFSALYVSLVRAGEASGKLEDTLVKLAETLETKEDFQGKLKGAMVYPVIVISMMIVIGIVMMIMVIPKISQVYTEFGASLPLPTQILVAISNYIMKFWFTLLLLPVLIAFLPKILKSNVQTAHFYNNFAYKVPVIGELQQEVLLTIFCRTFSSLIGSGVPISKVLQISGEVLGENDYKSAILECRTKIEKGFTFSESLKKFSLFPTVVPQMVSMGEETGKLDEAMARLSDYFAQLADRRSKTLTAAMEPLLIICLGIGVGGLALAILLPLFNLVSVIR